MLNLQTDEHLREVRYHASMYVRAKAGHRVKGQIILLVCESQLHPNNFCDLGQVTEPALPQFPHL